jgi:hypothetical protein
VDPITRRQTLPIKEAIPVQIEISDDLANTLQRKAHQAGFNTVESYLLFLVEEQEPARDESARMPYDQWREEFLAFVKSQISRNPNFDDSRESIYLGP